MHTPHTAASRGVGGLALLNMGLVLTLALVIFMPASTTSAQPAPASRARGSYTMVAGRVQGQVEAAIYIVDAANQEMIAMRWDRSRKQLKALGYQDLTPGRRPAPGNSNKNPSR